MRRQCSQQWMDYVNFVLCLLGCAAPATFHCYRKIGRAGGDKPFCKAYIEDIIVFQIRWRATSYTYSKC